MPTKKKSITKRSCPVSGHEGHFPTFKDSDPYDRIDLLCTIIDNIGDEVMLLDTEGRILYVNDATIHNTGHSREFFARKRIMDFFEQKISIRKWKEIYLTDLKKLHTPRSYVVDRKIKGNHKQTISITAVRIRYKKTDYVLSIARDISKQIEMQRKLQESKELYLLLSEGAGDGIFTCDLNGKIVYANRALEELVRIPLEESQGKSFRRYVAKDSIPKAMKCFLKAKSGIHQNCEEIEILNRERHPIPVEINVSPLLKNGRISFIHAIIRDVRSRRQLEHVMIESNKIKAIQYVISGTAQELRYPLLGIARSTQDLLKKYRDRNFEYIGYKEHKDIIATIGAIHKQIDYCCQTIDRLLDIGRDKVGLKKQYCHPHFVLKDALHHLEPQLDLQKVHIRCQWGKEVPHVAVGRIELTQVITNIMNNAMQAMPAGGTCRIKTRYLKNESQVTIMIQDEGIGIPNEDLPHIFEPFYSTKQRGVNKNSGLGLSIVASLIKSSQGDIRVSSSLRRGTTVTIFLPIVTKK